MLLDSASLSGYRLSTGAVAQLCQHSRLSLRITKLTPPSGETAVSGSKENPAERQGLYGEGARLSQKH